MRAVVAVVVVVVLGTACGGSDEANGPPVLLVGTPSGVTVFDTATSTLSPPAPRAVTSPDGALLVRADLLGTRTWVRAVDLASATNRWDARVEGTFEPRAVSADGARVALTPPPGALEAGAVAPGRTTTDLAVVHNDGTSETYEVNGNVEPEAFSLDGTTLFVVQYLPARLPTSYQVRQLDLATGELADVESVDGELHGRMSGTARTQVWDPDGSRLYTLYTQEVGNSTTAFVHVLDLDEEWAHCVLLPDGFTPSSAGVALADGAKDLYVADVVGGVVAKVDTQELTVVDEATMDPVPTAYMSPMAVVGETVFVGADRDVRRLDRVTLDELGSLRTGVDVVGIQRGRDETAVFIATPGALLLLDLATGSVLERTLADESMGSFQSLGARTIPT
jgi:hypothetical protein